MFNDIVNEFIDPRACLVGFFAGVLRTTQYVDRSGISETYLRVLVTVDPSQGFLPSVTLLCDGQGKFDGA